MEKIILIITLLSIIILSLFSLSTSKKQFRFNIFTPQENSIFSSTPIKQKPANELSNKEYEDVKLKFFSILEDQNPKVALIELANIIEQDNAVLRACHPLVHELGHKAYEKYGDFTTALNYEYDLCNQGYLHGVIEAHFEAVQDVFAAMETVCSTTSTLNSQIRCYHGVGHGLMYYTANDLPQSLTMCNSYKTSVAQENCIQGVFMENATTDRKLHPSKYLRDYDPFYPCQESFTNPYKSVCYYYAPRFYVSIHRDEFENALRWCNSAEPDYRSACANGLGAIAIKLNMKKTKEVEKICIQGDPSLINSCIDGMVGYYVYFYNSLEKGKALCELLQRSNQRTCSIALNGRPELLKN